MKSNFNKKTLNNLKLYLSLPHFKITIIILLMAIICGVISLKTYKNNDYISSLLTNIFSGIVTGLVINLILTIKSISLYQTECLINWLESLHKDILHYIQTYKKLIYNKSDILENDELFYNDIYDMICDAHYINSRIIHNSDNTSLPFNTYEYVKKNVGYDALIYSNKDKKLRKKIINNDYIIPKLSKKELQKLFNETNIDLHTLNAKILNHIAHLKAKRKTINNSPF